MSFVCSSTTRPLSSSVTITLPSSRLFQNSDWSQKSHHTVDTPRSLFLIYLFPSGCCLQPNATLGNMRCCAVTFMPFFFRSTGELNSLDTPSLVEVGNSGFKNRRESIDWTGTATLAAIHGNKDSELLATEAR
jgi:hypothetical protein